MFKQENIISDNKSIRLIRQGRNGLDKIASACVAFANTQGGKIRVGIEDGENAPP